METSALDSTNVEAAFQEVLTGSYMLLLCFIPLYTKRWTTACHVNLYYSSVCTFLLCTFYVMCVFMTQTFLLPPAIHKKVASREVTRGSISAVTLSSATGTASEVQEERRTCCKNLWPVLTSSGQFFPVLNRIFLLYPHSGLRESMLMTPGGIAVGSRGAQGAAATPEKNVIKTKCKYMYFLTWLVGSHCSTAGIILDDCLKVTNVLKWFAWQSDENIITGCNFRKMLCLCFSNNQFDWVHASDWLIVPGRNLHYTVVPPSKVASLRRGTYRSFVV